MVYRNDRVSLGRMFHTSTIRRRGVAADVSRRIHCRSEDGAD